ncbi:MBG domain-containing protein, partial [Salinimicrobium marinum]|uniref:MBG domain-containing protein n=1 Tax=Salinimicrobium marinum TaxID=680283 RepID=UPI004032C614
MGEDVGAYAIEQGSLALSSNYDLTYNDADLIIKEAAITVSADAKSKVYGEADPALTYQITSGALVGNDSFTGSLSREAGEDVGTYEIQLGSLALSSNYDLTYNDADLTIKEASITVTGDAKSKTYGEADPALTYQIISGTLIGNDEFTGSLTREVGEDVGTYAIEQGSLALSSNYDLTYNTADLTIKEASITITADGKSKIYGEADPVLTYQITSGTLVGNDDFTGSLMREVGEDVGTYAIQQGSLALSSNYDLTYQTGDLTIKEALITITADAKLKVYGEADPALTYQITSGTLVGNDDFTGSLTREVGEDVGTYAIQQGSLALSSNYDLIYQTADFTIKEAAITVTADAKSKVYGEADPALTYQITSGALVGGDSFTGSLTRETGEDVGTYEIQQGSLALSSNYDLIYNNADLTIKEAAITVSADAKLKVYGEADPALTYQITSGALVGNDSFIGSLSREAGEDVGTYEIQQGSLSLSSNYDLIYNNADLTIKEAAITVSADAKLKVYGEADPALTYQITSGFTGLLTREVGEDVGTYEIQLGSLALSSNYDLTYNNADFTIKEAAITVTADAKSKVYGEADPALTYKITSGALVGNDDFTGSLSREAGEDVGTYEIQLGSLALSSNYDLTYNTADLTIKEAAITVSADAKSKIYGEIDPVLTYQITSGTLVGND